MIAELCSCGQPLHYTNDEVETEVRRLIDKLGPTIEIKVEGTTKKYKVPRHYIALHGIKAIDLDALGRRYHWELV